MIKDISIHFILEGVSNIIYYSMEEQVGEVSWETTMMDVHIPADEIIDNQLCNRLRLSIRDNISDLNRK